MFLMWTVSFAKFPKIDFLTYLDVQTFLINYRFGFFIEVSTESFTPVEECLNEEQSILSFAPTEFGY